MYIILKAKIASYRTISSDLKTTIMLLWMGYLLIRRIISYDKQMFTSKFTCTKLLSYIWMMRIGISTIKIIIKSKINMKLIIKFKYCINIKLMFFITMQLLYVQFWCQGYIRWNSSDWIYILTHSLTSHELESA